MRKHVILRVEVWVAIIVLALFGWIIFRSSRIAFNPDPPQEATIDPQIEMMIQQMDFAMDMALNQVDTALTQAKAIVEARDLQEAKTTAQGVINVLEGIAGEHFSAMEETVDLLGLKGTLKRFTTMMESPQIAEIIDTFPMMEVHHAEMLEAFTGVTNDLSKAIESFVSVLEQDNLEQMQALVPEGVEFLQLVKGTTDSASSQTGGLLFMKASKLLHMEEMRMNS